MACNGCADTRLAGDDVWDDGCETNTDARVGGEEDRDATARLLGDGRGGSGGGAAGTPRFNLKLLDRALEDVGVGRYQNVVLALATFSIFFDVAEMALTGLLYVEFEREWHVGTDKLAIIGSASAAGLMLGSIACGWISDKYGRTRAFGPTLVVCTVFGVLSSFANSVASFAACRFAVGIAAGGNVVLCNSLLLESVPNSRRGSYVLFTGISFGLAHLFMVTLAWILFPTLGWRWVTRITAVLFLPVLGLFQFVVESPRFFVFEGRNREAEQALRKIAAVNGQPCPDYFCEEVLRASFVGGATAPSTRLCSDPVRALGGIPRLARSRNIQVLVPLMTVWFLQAFASGIFQFLPLELKRVMEGKHVQYVTSVVMASAGLLGTLLNLSLIQRFSRRYTLRLSTVLSAGATASLMLGNGTALLFVSVFFMHVTSCITSSTLFLYTPEIFPTKVRGTMMGLCLVAFRLANIASPFLVAAMATVSLKWSSIVFSCLYLSAALASWGLTEEAVEGELFEGEAAPGAAESSGAFPGLEGGPAALAGTKPPVGPVESRPHQPPLCTPGGLEV